MPTWLRRTLIIIGIALFLLIIGIFMAKRFTPNQSTINNLPTLPNILNRLTPKQGDIDSIPIDPTGGVLDASDIIIKDENLADGQKKLAEMESTLITYRKNLTEAQTKLSSYEAQINQPQGREVTETIYGSNFSVEIQKLKQSIQYYNKIIFIYETLVQKFKSSMVYYYCNGYTPKLPGETVDITKLAYNIIIVHHTNGTTSELSCAWDGVPTEFTPDSPFHPQNFFDGIPQEYLGGVDYEANNPFKDVAFNYQSEDQWGDFTPQLTDIVWKSTPPVWYYYLNVFFTLYIDISVDISIDISSLWKNFFNAYPIDDLTRYENVHVWVDRYKTFTNDAKLTVWGLIQTGHPMNKVCPILRMGILSDASWHYTKLNGKRSINYADKVTCEASRLADQTASSSVCTYDATKKPDPANPPDGLKGFFKGILADIKEAFTLKYYMDGLDPASILEFPISVVEGVNWNYTVTGNKTSQSYDSKALCEQARAVDSTAIAPCTHSLITSSTNTGYWILWYQEKPMKNSILKGTFANKADCEKTRAQFPKTKDIKTECAQKTGDCTSTVPGQSKQWFVIIPDYDPNQPYLFDIVDATYHKFEFNWNTFTVQDMAYRYWGPQFISQIDTQHVYASLQQRLDVSTDALSERLGFPVKPEPYTTNYNRSDQTLDILFRIQTNADRRVSSTIVNGDPKENTFSLPLELYYSKLNPDGTVATITAQPTLVSKRTTVQSDGSENDIAGTLVNVQNEYDTVYLYYEGIPGLVPEDSFALVDTQRQESLVSGKVGEVAGYGSGAWSDKWYYVISYKPQKFSEYFDSKEECERVGKQRTVDPNLVCYVRKIKQLRIEKLHENERNEKGESIGTKFSAKKGRLVYRVSTWGQPVTFGLAYGNTPEFKKMKTISPDQLVNTTGIASEIMTYNLPDLEPGKQYYYKLYHAGSSVDAYNSIGYLLLEGATGQSYPIFDAGAFLASEDDTKKLSFDDLFKLNTGSPGSLSSSSGGAPGASGLVPCGVDTNKDGRLDKEEQCDFNDVIRLVSNALNFILFVLLPAIIVFFVAKSAYLFITQGDNPASIKLAKSTLKWTFIGVLIMLLSWYLVSLLFNLLGLQEYSWLALQDTVDREYIETIDRDKSVG